jgi:DNA-binding protein HU-beta
MRKGQNEEYGVIKVRGLIVPADWDPNGAVITIGLSAFDEGEYLIDNDENGRELFSFMRQEVEISGEMRKEEEKMVIKVSQFSLGRAEKMNKHDLINEVSNVLGNKKEAQAAVDCVLKTITHALRKNDMVTLAGFGTFRVDRRKARKGRNPRTGEEIHIQARNIPRFVPGKALKDAVN